MLFDLFLKLQVLLCIGLLADEEQVSNLPWLLSTLDSKLTCIGSQLLQLRRHCVEVQQQQIHSRKHT